MVSMHHFYLRRYREVAPPVLQFIERHLKIVVPADNAADKRAIRGIGRTGTVRLQYPQILRAQPDEVARDALVF